MSDVTVKVENISKKFEKKEVLNGLSLTLRTGSVFGLVGLNGAGKTTLIRILLGLLRADAGTCQVLGHDPAKQEKELYQRTGVVLEHNGFFGNLTVRANLAFFAEARGIQTNAAQTYFDEYWADTDIGKDTRSVKYFSRGQKMQCALCRAFLGWPELYLFDEPAVALDIEAYGQFCTFVRAAQGRGATIIISSHQLDTIEELCTEVGVLENGSITLLNKKTDIHNGEQWLIRTGNDVPYQSIIMDITGSPAHFYDGAWHFTLVSTPEKQIAELVTRLVSAGAAVSEVRCEKEDYRKSIKKHYGAL